MVFGLPAADAGGKEETFSSPSRALPGFAQLGAAQLHAPGVALSTASGYGYTEAVLGRDDTHHRGRADLALSYRPNSWLGFGVAFQGRYDRHVGEGVDDGGYVGTPRLVARAVRRAPGALTLGADATLWLPGDDAPSIVPGAATLEMKGLASYAPRAWGRHALHVNAGVRLDRSAASAPEADRLSLAHRLALGVSDSHALLVGAGWSARLAPATVFAEWSWDVHVGSDAPALRHSPMRLGAGAQVPIGERYAVVGLGEIALSSRPPIERSEPLVPVEPRASLLAGLSYRFGGDATGPPPSAAPTGAIQGRLTSAEEGALEGARIRARAASTDAEVTSGEDGSFRIEGLPSGRAEIMARAPGHRDRKVEVDIEPPGATEVTIALEPKPPRGELKGLVLSYDGTPIDASIRVEPIGLALDAGEDGRFRRELAPGEYVVSISAPGHRKQKRRVTVEQQGVTVLNIDLRRVR